jgi:SAM-dependent methyltransferase
MSEPYHRFVFQDGQLVADFESMYQAECTEGFDSWHQDDLARRTDIVDLLRSLEFESVIDIGCGKGALLSEARAARVVGVDMSPTALQTALRRLPHGEFRCRDALSAADPGERFDLVMLVAVLYYIPEWRRVLELAATIGNWLLVGAYVPEQTAGTIESITVLRKEVEALFSIEREIGGGEAWGALARANRRALTAEP